MEISGKRSTAKINAGDNVKGVQKSRSAGRAAELDGATAEDEGYEHPCPGLRGMSIDLTIVIDLLAGDLTTLTEGTTITNLGIYTSIDDADPVRLISEFLVLEAVFEAEVQGRCMYSVSGKSVGPYTNNDPP